jgi:hypothetical protein
MGSQKVIPQGSKVKTHRKQDFSRGDTSMCEIPSSQPFSRRSLTGHYSPVVVLICRPEADCDGQRRGRLGIAITAAIFGSGRLPVK